ncbi:LpqB family beta-propeller domain-containing protein [Microbacterium sp. No. 7]|uniref:LpqB family beta-propeller domain-containing protein n=1 Tax=Microbacterium sp. No. 7 TaxID=1714373 RepID=UPI0006D2C003|nr:LpqB family beta-propeller domain-containing protein [Microbacterium sp. No. 7]ALJ21276.1 hypothetical protein AOA12_15765 [Microbacterium sp. No. 7]
MTARSLRALAVCLLVVALAACAGLPTRGPVNAGGVSAEVDREADFAYLPDRPVEDATPEQIVDGFLAAGSGPRGNWSIAREFLAPSYRDQWDPRAGVTIHRPGRPVPVLTGDGTVQVSVHPTGAVDHTGAYTSEVGGDVTLEFRLAQNADGQWRIVQAPSGIVIDEGRFATVFRNYPVMFFDPTWTYLVPDERWFPREFAATYIAEALVGGSPSPWLTDAVVTAFTESSRVEQRAVPVRQGVAQVSLGPAARSLEQTVLDRMQTQLQHSLAGAGIRSVAMMVGDQTLSATAVHERSTRIDPRPLLLTAEGFGFPMGESLEVIPGLSSAITALEEPPVAIEVDADRTSAAVRFVDGSTALVSAEGDVVPLGGPGSTVAPSVDPFGFAWTVDATEAAVPTVFAADGDLVELTVSLPGVTRIDALQVSRDGTRLAVVGRDGTVPTLWVAGIVRDRDGTPVRLGGERRILATLGSRGMSLTWLDAETVAVLTAGEGETHVHEQRIGGGLTVRPAPADAVLVTGSSQSGGLRVLDAAGILYLQRGGTWQNVATDVLGVAIQQGTPE